MDPFQGIATKHGLEILHDPHLNKGTAFNQDERISLRLQGLLPPRIFMLQEQIQRALENLRRKTSSLEKYIFLTSLQERNETLFYRLVIDHLEEALPLIYTPTVGQACQEYGHIFRRPMGMFITKNDRGRISEILDNWSCQDVRVTVVMMRQTDLSSVIVGSYQHLADRTSLEPCFFTNEVGLLCVRAVIHLEQVIAGMVVISGIAPVLWPPNAEHATHLAATFQVKPGEISTHLHEVHHLDKRDQDRVLRCVQRIADIFSHIAKDRNVICGKLQAIASLTTLDSGMAN